MKIKVLTFITFISFTVFFISCREEESVEKSALEIENTTTNTKEIEEASIELEENSKALENELNELKTYNYENII